MTPSPIDRPPRARGHVVANLLLTVVSLVAFLALLESGARWLRLRTGYYLASTAGNCLRRSALLEWELRPSCTGRVQGAPVRSNAAGLRGPELRDDGSVRILGVGDSCTFGWSVREDQAYPAVLERNLNRRGTGRFQVINAGLAGFSSYQGLLYLRERGLALRPRIVIIGFGFNELFRDGDDEGRLARGRRVMPLLRLDDFLLEHSTLYRWTRWQLHTTAEADLGYRVTPEQYDRNLRAMVGLARAHGAHVVLLDFFARPLTETPERRYPDALAAVGRDLDVPLVVYDGPRFDVVHPTVEGYERLAGDLEQTLARAGYLHEPAAGEPGRLPAPRGAPDPGAAE